MNMELFLDGNPIPMVICDRETLMLRKANTHFTELYGYSSEEVSGGTLTLLDMHSGDPSEIVEDYLNGTSDDNPLGNQTWEHYSKSGERLYVKVFAQEHVWESDRVLVCSLADVTEQVHLQTREQQEVREKLEKSLEEKQVLLEEVHHRVKNNLAIISGLLQMQILHVDDERLTQYIKNSQMRIQSMAIVHEMLYKSEKLSEIHMNDYVKKLTDVISDTLHPDEKSIKTEVETDPIVLNINQAIPCALIISELISNAYTFAFEGLSKGLITISLKKDKNLIRAKVQDDGIGLPDNFEEMRKKSLGLTLIENLCQQLDADIDIATGEWGTSFEVRFEKREEAGSSSSNRV